MGLRKALSMNRIRRERFCMALMGDCLWNIDIIYIK